MKIRTSFVSNSSSSSYILAFHNTNEPQLQICPHCKQAIGTASPTLLQIFLDKLRDGDQYEDTSMRAPISIETARELIDDNPNRTAYEFIEQVSLEEWTLWHIDIGYHDDLTKYLRDRLEEQGLIKTFYIG